MFKNVKILTWLVVILFATNLATIVTVLYNNNEIKTKSENDSELPLERRSRFFDEQLTFDQEQMESFRGLNKDFNRKSAELSTELQTLREEILQELTKENSDTVKLNQLSAEIGEKHKELKMATNKLYLDLKELSDSTQQERLAVVFRSLLEGDNTIKNPRRRGKQQNR